MLPDAGLVALGVRLACVSEACACFGAAQFERTLIIAEDDSQVSYLEGCTAPSYDSNQVPISPWCPCMHSP
jgi:Fe-S cluster assembly scaffold protein SufB